MRFEGALIDSVMRFGAAGGMVADTAGDRRREGRRRQLQVHEGWAGEYRGGGGEGGRANYPACAGDAMWGVEGAFNCLCGLIAGHLGVVDATGRIANRDGILLVPRADGGMAL